VKGGSPGTFAVCLGRPEFSWQRPLFQVLEALPYPVILVDDVGIRMSNTLARAELCHVTPNVAEDPVEMVEGCGRSHLPEGCRRTLCCAGCAIPQAVAQTFETGAARFFVPAAQNVGCADDPSDASIHITSMKLSNVVVLQVDGMAKRGAQTLRAVPAVDFAPMVGVGVVD